MLIKLRNQHLFNFLIIFIVSLILCLPQIISHSMILGSDSIFHFNRFYDTAQQIKNNNYEYFISLYGFQQTGRIITPLYSPIFSYFFGLILLLAGSWFKFQLISNFLLFLSSGYFMTLLLEKIKVRRNLGLQLSLFYMTTYSVSYWIIRQGYSSWGAAFFPLCLIPLVEIIDKQKFNPLKVALSVSVMFQLHFLSCIFLLLFYLYAFIYCYFLTTKKIELIFELIKSILIFIIINFNIWIAIIKIYANNEIIQPFINKDIYKTTITGSSSYWAMTPIILPILLTVSLFIIIKKYRLKSNLNKFFSVTLIIFLILSSNLFPWKFLYQSKVEWINVIQFPFRFFIPATICLICCFGLDVSENIISFNIQKIGRIAIIISLIYSAILYSLTLSLWSDNDLSFIKNAGGIHLFVKSTDLKKVKTAFYSDDLSLALELVQKSTPDYLPKYGNSEKNRYKLYEEYVLFNESSFNKSVKGRTLIIQWKSEKKEQTIIPVIKYKNTKLKLNGKVLLDVKLTTIGNPIIESKIGNNILELTYEF